MARTIEGEPGNVIQNLYHCMCVYIALILHTQVGSYGLISLIRTLIMNAALDLGTGGIALKA